MALLRPGTLHGAALKAAEKGPRMSKIGTLIRIVVALSLLLAAPANAQNVRFHDRAGRVTGSARTDANGVTTFHDRAGRVTGTARTDRNGVTTFRTRRGAPPARSGGERRTSPTQVA